MCRGCVNLEMCDNLQSFSCRRKITFYDGMVTMASIMRVDWHRRSAVKKLHTRRGQAKMNEQNRVVVEAVTQRFISIIQRGWPLKGGAHEKLPLNNKLGENEMHVRSIHKEKNNVIWFRIQRLWTVTILFHMAMRAYLHFHVCHIQFECENSQCRPSLTLVCFLFLSTRSLLCRI